MASRNQINIGFEPNDEEVLRILSAKKGVSIGQVVRKIVSSYIELNRALMGVQNE